MFLPACGNMCELNGDCESGCDSFAYIFRRVHIDELVAPLYQCEVCESLYSRAKDLCETPSCRAIMVLISWYWRVKASDLIDGDGMVSVCLPYCLEYGYVSEPAVEHLYLESQVSSVGDLLGQVKY